MNRYAGVDVGGTNIAVGIVDEAGAVLARCKIPTRAEAGADDVLARIAETIRRLAQQLGLAPEDIRAGGAGIPGLVDPHKGVSLHAANLRWRGVPVADKLRELLPFPMIVDNDVKLYVYGEAARGAGRSRRHVLGLTIGTGLASALVHDGAIYYGADALAGELGHVPIDGERTPCSCGLTGCLETVVSATGIARQAREALQAGQPSLLRERFADPADVRSADVSRACLDGDALAADVLAHTGRTLGRALSYVVPVLSPDVIVVGGGGALAGEALFEPMKRELSSRLLPEFRERLDVRPAALGDDAGIIGSALRARQLLHTPTGGH